MLAGGCFCGRVRYEARGTPFNATICHCGDCRRLTGAPMVAWFSVRPDTFVIVAGEPRRRRSSASAERTFCADCGTPLTYYNDAHPDDIDIATATLDAPDRVPPQDHTRTRHKLAWVTIADGLPQHADLRR